MNERWTTDADGELREAVLAGKGVKSLAESMDRTEGAIRSRMRRLGVADRNGVPLAQEDLEWTVDLSNAATMDRFGSFLQRFLPEAVFVEATSPTVMCVRLAVGQPGHTEPVLSAEEPQFSATMEALRAWRREQARIRGVSPFIVAWNCHLEEICARSPRTLEELGAVRGIGKAFLERYGSDVLAIVAGEPVASRIEDTPDSVLPPADRVIPSPTAIVHEQSLDFLPSRANEGLVEALPPEDFRWGVRHPDPEVMDHWKSFAFLWMKLLEGEVQPISICEHRVLDFLPVWNGSGDLETTVLWERALREYCRRVAARRNHDLRERGELRDPRQEFFPDSQVGRLGPYRR